MRHNKILFSNLVRFKNKENISAPQRASLRSSDEEDVSVDNVNIRFPDEFAVSAVYCKLSRFTSCP